MASTVTNISNLINNNYPVKGIKNDLKGFRDNFSRIKTSLNIVESEIQEVRAAGVYLNQTNDFNYSTVTNAIVENCTIILKSYP